MPEMTYREAITEALMIEMDRDETVVIMGEDLSSLAHAVRLSRRTRRIVRQNLAFALCTMTLLVLAASMGSSSSLPLTLDRRVTPSGR